MTIRRRDLNDLILACRILDHASDDDVLKWAQLHDMLLRILMQHDMLTDLSTMPKARLSSIYGEFHNKENSPEA